MLERADRQWEEHGKWERLVDLRPSEAYANSFSATTIGDPLAIQLRDVIGIDTMLWECDFPHAESPWPNMQNKLEASFAGVPEDDVERITHGNAARLFRWESKVGVVA